MEHADVVNYGLPIMMCYSSRSSAQIRFEVIMFLVGILLGKAAVSFTWHVSAAVTQACAETGLKMIDKNALSVNFRLQVE